MRPFYRTGDAYLEPRQAASNPAAHNPHPMHSKQADTTQRLATFCAIQITTTYRARHSMRTGNMGSKVGFQMNLYLEKSCNNLESI